MLDGFENSLAPALSSDHPIATLHDEEDPMPERVVHYPLAFGLEGLCTGLSINRKGR